MAGFSNAIYEKQICSLLGKAFYEQNPQEEKIRGIKDFSLLIVRKLFDIPKNNTVFTFNHAKKRISEKKIDFLPNIIDTLISSEHMELEEALGILNKLYASLFIDYFQRYRFGSNDLVLASFSLLPPVIRYTVLEYLYKKEPSNKSVIDKLALAILKTFGKEQSFAWLESEKPHLESVAVYDENYPFELANRFGATVAIKILASEPKNMYVFCKDKIETLAGRLEKNDGNLYTTFEEALPFYIKEGRITGDTEEIEDFNSLMEFCYIGRRPKITGPQKKESEYIVGTVRDAIYVQKRRPLLYIESIGVQNFRSLKNIPPQPIKPVTVLVGKNSSGKSTFLRLLPMLKQSIEGKSLGALALYGEDVDFGDFKDVLTDHSEDDYIALSFKGMMDSGERSFLDYNLHIQVKESESMQNLYIADYDISIGQDCRIRISASDKGIIKDFSINGTSYKQDMEKISLVYEGNSSSILPLLKNSERQGNIFFRPFLSLVNNDLQIYRIITEADIAILQDKDTAFKIINSALKDLPNAIQFSGDDLHYSHLVFAKFEDIFTKLGQTLAAAFGSIYYSKPLRANTERYYRNQPLSVKEISADGSNLIQFYMKFTAEEKKSFRRWMSDNFGFDFEVKSKGNMHSIIINDEGQKHNIVDEGYGYTQILPILLQLWSIIHKKDVPRTAADIIYAIEQPELHLHPGLQKKLLRAIVAVTSIARTNDRNIRFVLETHSRTFIQNLGDLVSTGSISPEDIHLMVFDKAGGITEVRDTDFDKDGNLHNWPIGFFN